MARDYKDLEREVLDLDLDARASLAEVLLRSLDDLSEAEVECLWLDEAERRQREIQSGAVAEIPADEVLRRARAAIS
jgi:putative addiction module component